MFRVPAVVVFNTKGIEMLALTRRPGETVHIGDDITVTVVEVRGDKVRLAFEAPRDVRIMRGELLEDERKVTVCDACLCASCWYGEFMCQNSQHAGITEKTVAELRQLNREHSRYWSQEYIAKVCGEQAVKQKGGEA